MWLKDPGYNLYALSCCVWNFAVQDHAVCDILDIWIAHVTCGNLLENVLEKKHPHFFDVSKHRLILFVKPGLGWNNAHGPQNWAWIFCMLGPVVQGRFISWDSLRMFWNYIGLPPPNKKETEFESTSWEFLNKQFKAPVKKILTSKMIRHSTSKKRLNIWLSWSQILHHRNHDPPLISRKYKAAGSPNDPNRCWGWQISFALIFTNTWSSTVIQSTF